MSEQDTVTITRARVQRMIDVLSLISLDEFDPALTTIESSGESDAVAYLEESLNVFVRELGQAREDAELHVARLEERGRELVAKLETIERQREAIRDLSMPIIELWDEVVTLPVVGVVDTQRSLEMTTGLLEAVAEGGYRCAIVDLTGVDVVDTATADVPHLFLLIDVRQASGIDSRARKKISELTKARPYVASAVIGASFPIRVAIELIVNAARLLVKDSAETRFVDDEAAANAWFVEVRQQIASGALVPAPV